VSRVGIVVPGFSASETDWCIPALLSLVRRLAESDSVRVFALRYPHRTSSYPVFGSQVHSLGGAAVRGLKKLPLLRRAIAAIVREHRREPFDVLHAFWIDEPGYVATSAARALSLPSVATLLGGELVSLPEIGYGGKRSRLNRILAQRALRNASLVTAGSRSLAALADGAGRRPEVVPIGVDLERFCSGDPVPALLGGGTRLLHVASLVPVKDQRTLLGAFARVSRAIGDAVLNVVGDGPLRGELSNLCRELGIERRVVFHGAVAHHDLPRYYRSCDLAVLSSLHEGQEWVTQEAAACGKTTVGTRVGVVPDLEPATIAVPAGDASALASGVLEALSDRRRLRARGLLARKKAVERYSLSGTVAALRSIYAELGRNGRMQEREMAS
jgi:glycosyltransferase involved in cell wall biosynthesis